MRRGLVNQFLLEKRDIIYFFNCKQKEIIDIEIDYKYNQISETERMFKIHKNMEISRKLIKDYFELFNNYRLIFRKLNAK